MLGFVYLVAVIALCLLVANLRRTVLGQQMLAVRANERAAAAAGINVARVKITAYAISSFIAGTAGWMYAYNFGSVSAARFGILIALGFVAFAYIGGITMVSGAVIGGLVATEGLVPHFFQEILGISGNWTLLVGGLILIVTLIQNPEGVAGTTYRKRQASKRAAAAAASGTAGGSAAGARNRWTDGDGQRTMSTVLSARGISVSFGGVHAVVDVDLDVEPGQLVGLIGPNGAGKTTFIDAVTGFVQHRGTVELDGADITGLPPHARARRGLARTWQSIELFDDLSVRENLTVAAQQPSLLTTLKELFARPVAMLRRGRRGARSVRARRPRRGDTDRAHTGPAQARRRRPSAGCRPEAAVPRRAGGRPRRARSRSRSAATCARSSIAARRSSSSTTTWDSCSGSATVSWCSSSAR